MVKDFCTPEPNPKGKIMDNLNQEQVTLVVTTEDPTQSNSLIPMLIAGLVMVTLGMILAFAVS